MKLVPSLSETLPPPIHVGIIMDGNGRWAQARGMPRIAGHRQGAESVRTAVKSARDMGIQYLTLYGFSIENWKRPMTEVSALMGLLRLYLRQEIQELDENGVRIRFIGERERLAPDIVALIDEAESRTAGNTKLTLIVALSYGARQEITTAARDLARKAKSGEIDLEDIDEALLENHLATAGIPDLDLVIRTSGEKRVSNFLLWQLAYAELVFIDALWPDFARRDLEEAINEFHRRERRYGATG
ncbi:MAG: isoprenyl transferase [Rhodospirillaceae bacterium]|jgi:undecaprenyl diphosphate synthase|nr:isoprenyl transferase [Rhodospirillaceae bacterium]